MKPNIGRGVFNREKMKKKENKSTTKAVTMIIAKSEATDKVIAEMDNNMLKLHGLVRVNCLDVESSVDGGEGFKYLIYDNKG